MNSLAIRVSRGRLGVGGAGPGGDGDEQEIPQHPGPRWRASLDGRMTGLDKELSQKLDQH